MSQEFPILLNCWKHHAGFIKNQIRKGGFSEGELQTRLTGLWYLGDSPTDLYLGDLLPFQVKAFVYEELHRRKLSEKHSYLAWLAEKRDFQQVLLPDRSCWILRAGFDQQNFIHIHPARGSLHSIRVKGITLKTAVLSQMVAHGKLDSSVNLSFINEIRSRFFGLSPMKGDQPGKMLKILLDLFKIAEPF